MRAGSMFRLHSPCLAQGRNMLKYLWDELTKYKVQVVKGHTREIGRVQIMKGLKNLYLNGDGGTIERFMVGE